MEWITHIFNRKIEIPDSFDFYSKAFSRDHKKVLLAKPLSEVRFVALDTETTGLNPKADRILSIGAIGVKNFTLNVMDSFEENVAQEIHNSASIPIHEITPEASKDARTANNVLNDFLHFLNDAIIIGHNVQFDFQILSQAIQRHFGFPLMNYSYDTAKLVQRVDTHFSSAQLFRPEELSLDNLCSRYQIDIHDRHTAMGDAMATALLFVKLLKKVEKRKIRNLKELLRR